MMVRYAGTAFSVILKPVKTWSLPLRVTLEPTTRCPLDCVHCRRKSYINQPKDLSLAEAKRVLDQVRPKSLVLCGLGEPFMNPELVDIISYARTLRAFVGTTTNMVVRPMPYDDLVRSGLNYLKISMDAASKEVYEKLRVRGVFDTVIDGVKQVVDAKRRLGSKVPYTCFQLVIQADNVGECTRLVELAAKLRVDAVKFVPVSMWGIKERREEIVGGLTFHRIASELKVAKQRAKELGVQTNLDGFFQKVIRRYWQLSYMDDRTTARSVKECSVPWFSLVVLVDGDIQLCGYFGYSGDKLGNAFQDDIRSVWNGEKYRAIRRALREGRAPFPRCEDCIPQNVISMAPAIRSIAGMI